MIKKLVFLSMVIILSIALVISGCSEPEETSPGTTTPSGSTTPATTPSGSTTPATTPSGSTTPATTPTSTASPTEEPQYGGVLRLISNEGPSSPIGIPELQRGQSSHKTRGNCIENLLDYDTINGQYLPKLAESWEWSDDHLTITFNLRQGVRFHDGTDFNADAVLWNWDQRMATGASGIDVIESYEKLDDHTVRIHLTAYQNVWLSRMYGITENSLGMMISPTAAAKGDEYIEYNPVGTGPFVFKEFVRDDYLEYERNNDYWGGKPYLDGLKYIFITDTVTMQMAFEAGQGDTVESMKFYELAHDLLPKGYKYEEKTGLMMSIVPCSGNPDSPFANPLVRQAIDYAIDKESICNSVFFGLAEPVYRFAPKGPMRYDVPGFEGRKYDPEKARQLLEDAGYPDGFETVYYSATHFSGADSQAIQANLNAVGIITTIDPITPGKWQELETNGWDDGLLLSPTPLNPGFTRYTSSLLRYIVTPLEPQWSYGLYWTSFKRPAALEDLVQAYALIPSDDEDALWDTALAIQEILYEDALILPLFEQMGGNIQQPWVMDMNFGSVYSGFDYLHCWIDPH